MKDYIIVEIIPTTRLAMTGDIAQLCAIKIINNKIESRLNLRLNKEKIQIPDVLKMTNYDNEKFKYYKTTNEILKKFKDYKKELEVIIIPNDYTKDYLSTIDNKISLCDVLNIEYSELIIDDLILKYNLEYSNDIVGIIYKSIKKNMK